MKKNCKIISTYFGPRRNKPNGIEDTINFWNDKILKYELEIDPGVKVDTIIVNHDYGNKKVKEYLDSLDGLSTKRGIIKIYNRPWDKGTGGSFLSFGKAFEKFKNEYDYWFFTEDNVIMIQDNYYLKALNQIEKKEKIGYICCMRAGSFDSQKKINKKWCHGACGLTKREHLEEVYNKFGQLPHSNEPIPNEIQEKIKKDDLSAFKIGKEINNGENSWYKKFCKDGEIEFTNQIHELGYELQQLEMDEKVAMWHECKY